MGTPGPVYFFQKNIPSMEWHRFVFLLLLLKCKYCALFYKYCLMFTKITGGWRLAVSYQLSVWSVDGWVGTTGEVTNLAYLFGGWRLAICDLRFGWGRPARLGNRAYRVWWLVVSGLGGTTGTVGKPCLPGLVVGG